jgi:amino acid adenylation domain-containing protein
MNFLNTLKTHSDKTAFHIDGIDYSYNTFYKKVKTISAEISGKQQQKIFVATNNDIETYASIIAIWQTGNIYIPVNFEVNNERLLTQLKAIDADIILSSEDINGIEIINTSNLKETQSELPNIQIAPNDLAYILFTSGTTGTPKGVPISYQNLDAFVDSFLSLGYGFSEKDNFLQMADLTFDMSFISFLIPLCVGATITTIDNSEIKYLATLQALLERDITVLITAPSTLQLLEPYYSEINLEQLKYTFVGAEAFYHTTAKEWQECAPNSEIINLYGPSEGGIFTSAYSLPSKGIKDHNGIVSIGKPIKNLELYIVNEDGILAEEGEIWISGKQVFNSYLNTSDNKNSFSDLTVNGKIITCYKSGDIAYQDEEGFLFYCGRKDNQVKIQGKRVELAEIEFYAAKMSIQFNPLAICYQSQFGSTQIALFIEKQISKDLLINHLKENLPDYMIPSKIIQLDSLPLNKNQKTDRKALQLMLQNN